MADRVVAFPKKPAPHLCGPVRCIGCKHEWVAVSPVGVYDELECPSCGALKGVRTSTIAPEDGEVWQCNCGNQLFFLTPTGAPLCANCGLRATSWAEG